MAGGGIKTSDEGSGEVEPASELSWLRDRPDAAAIGDEEVGLFDLCAFSMMPETSLGGMTALETSFFRFWGFMDGDWRTARVMLFEVPGCRFLDFRIAEGPDTGMGALKSMFISMGDVVSDESDRGRAP